MSHANAALTPRARLTVARLVIDQHVPIAEVAARFQCSWPTVKRWADRYTACEPPVSVGVAGLGLAGRMAAVSRIWCDS